MIRFDYFRNRLVVMLYLQFQRRQQVLLIAFENREFNTISPIFPASPLLEKACYLLYHVVDVADGMIYYPLAMKNNGRTINATGSSNVY
jgi:hypothetical protein